LQYTNHDIWPVVDSQNNIGYTSSGQSFDLVTNHRPVAELNKRLWESESLKMALQGHGQHSAHQLYTFEAKPLRLAVIHRLKM
jgi:hypothetical protein